MKIIVQLNFILLINLAILSTLYGQVFKTQKQALQQEFPDNHEIQRKVLFLTDTQIQTIQEFAKAKMESKLVTYYIGIQADSVAGYAFFATNIIRTKPVTIMVVLNPDGSVKHIEILAFYEPQDYLPRPNWLNLFKHKKLNNNLWPSRDIDGITGATLTVHSITRIVRKILSIYKVVIQKENLK